MLKKDLGFLNTKEPKTIKEKLFNLNKDLDKDSVEIGAITEKNLATVLTERNLGNLKSTSIEVIKDGLKAKNKDLDKDAIDIKTVTEKNPNSFTAKGDS